MRFWPICTKTSDAPAPLPPGSKSAPFSQGPQQGDVYVTVTLCARVCLRFEVGLAKRTSGFEQNPHRLTIDVDTGLFA